MIIDNTLVLSEAQAIVATARSTNVIDLGAMGTPYGHAAALALDIGEAAAGDIEIEVCVVEAFNNLTDLTITIETDDNAPFASPYEVAKRKYLLAELTLVPGCASPPSCRSASRSASSASTTP
jgi:hypothetical protein